MPIYEYRCRSCKRRLTVFVRSVSTSSPEACPHCGGKELVRLISSFATPKSEESRLENLAYSGLGNVSEDDPGSVAKFMRKMGKEMGEDLGSGFDEAVDRLEAGEEPDEGEQEAEGEKGKPNLALDDFI